MTPEQQVQQVENALVQQPDAIIVTPIDEESLVPVLQQAADQDVAVITLGATVSDPEVITSFVARDNLHIGRQKAQYVVDQLGGKGKVGIIHGIRGLTFTEEQAKGYEEVLGAELRHRGRRRPLHRRLLGRLGPGRHGEHADLQP